VSADWAPGMAKVTPRRYTMSRVALSGLQILLVLLCTAAALYTLRQISVCSSRLSELVRPITYASEFSCLPFGRNFICAREQFCSQ
jgi:hypothetical protein